MIPTLRAFYKCWAYISFLKVYLVEILWKIGNAGGKSKCLSSATTCRKKNIKRVIFMSYFSPLHLLQERRGLMELTCAICLSRLPQPALMHRKWLSAASVTKRLKSLHSTCGVAWGWMRSVFLQLFSWVFLFLWKKHLKILTQPKTVLFSYTTKNCFQAAVKRKLWRLSFFKNKQTTKLLALLPSVVRRVQVNRIELHFYQETARSLWLFISTCF